MARPKKFIKYLTHQEQQIIINELKIVIGKTQWLVETLEGRYGPGHEVSKRVSSLPTMIRRAGNKLAEIW